jgi:hypothetical protein
MSELEVRTAVMRVRETPDGTVYRIVNYDTYAVHANGQRDSERDAKRDRSETGARQEQQENRKPTATYTSDFEALWSLAKRGSKRKAFTEYKRAVPTKVQHGALLTARASHVARASEEKYVRHLDGWLRDERWEEANGNGQAKRGSVIVRPDGTRMVL